MFVLETPIANFVGRDGKPLTGGYVLLGQPGANPTFFPAATFWDSDLTQPAPQPLRTINGFVHRDGTPANVYTAGDFSLLVNDASGVQVGYWPAASAYSVASNIGASLADAATEGAGDAMLAVKLPVADAVPTTQHEVNSRTVSVLDFMTKEERMDVFSSAGLLDVTAALQKAINEAAAIGAKLVGCRGRAKITDTLVISGSCDFGQLKLNVNGAAVPVAVRVGPTTGYLFDADIVLPFVFNTAKTGAGWAGFENSVGVEIANVYQSRIRVPSVYNFGVGLTMGGYEGVGCVYNEISLGVIFGNRRNVELRPKHVAGWCNQNTLIGGRLAYGSSEGLNVAGTRQIILAAPVGTTTGSPNNNTFIGISIEGDEPEFHLDIEGAFNGFVNLRLETSAARGPASVRFYSQNPGDTTANFLLGGYDARGIEYTFAGAASPGNQRFGAKGANAVDCSGSGINISNSSGNNISAPHLQGVPSSIPAIGVGESNTNWTYRLFAEGISFKGTADAYPRVTMDSAGYLYLGRGGAAHTAYFRAGVGDEILVGASLLPEADNTRALGNGGQRWTTVYAATGTINTSDENAKQDISDIPDSWLDAWASVKWQRFKMREAVVRKGDGARWHVGLVAQRIEAAFAAAGIDAFSIGLLCYDETENGGVYGVRYEEALSLESAYLRREISKGAQT